MHPMHRLLYQSNLFLIEKNRLCQLQLDLIIPYAIAFFDFRIFLKKCRFLKMLTGYIDGNHLLFFTHCIACLQISANLFKHVTVQFQNISVFLKDRNKR